eukprot:366462-Chlamydomonas_euryale.AAC.3
MEVALKEGLREAERTATLLSRTGVDVQYLKNTVLRLYRTGEAESLLPVFGTILAFGPEELASCRAGLQRLKDGEVPLPGAAAAVDASLTSASTVMSSLTDWTSWAMGGGGVAQAPGGSSWNVAGMYCRPATLPHTTTRGQAAAALTAVSSERCAHV